MTIHNRMVMIPLMQAAQAVADNLFKALSDPTRRAIFEQLARDGEQTVHALTDRAGVSQPAVSKHLGDPETRQTGARPARRARDALPRTPAIASTADGLDDCLWRLLARPI